MTETIGPYSLNWVTHGDCTTLGPALPDESVDILVTSPPYWGQRMSTGMGVEDDPRQYLKALVHVFQIFQPKMKKTG
jgi:DNA modification methylase